MPWVRFTDDYLANDKITPLSAYARLLDMAAIVYSARELRDGHLSLGDVETVAAAARVPRWKASAAELVAARRWESNGGGYAIHDYLDYQPSKEHVLAEREAARVRKKSGRRPAGIPPDSARTPGDVQPDSSRVPYPVPGPVPGIPDIRPESGSPQTPLASEGGGCCTKGVITAGKEHLRSCSLAAS